MSFSLFHKFWSIVGIMLLSMVLTSLPESTAAQTRITIPSAWRKTIVNSTIQERIDIAAAAIDKAYGGSLSGAQELHLCTMSSDFDIATNCTRYKDKVSQYFTNQKINKVSYGALDPTQGYAAALAYIAYGDRAFLDIATKVWDSNNRYVLSSTGVPPALQGNSTLYNVLLDYRKCPNSGDLNGGLVHRGSLDVVTSENARFFRLSGLLAKITGNDTYLDATQQSAELFLSQLYSEGSLFWWKVNLDINSPCRVASKRDIEAWNAGYVIEGLAILLSIQSNDMYKDRVTQSLLAATKYSQWNNIQGILNVNGISDVVRGLSTVLADQESYGSDVSGYVEGYLGNQYNAVLEQATRNGTNVYGYPWLGPPPSVSSYSADGQLKAAGVLIAGIRLSSIPETSPPSETSSRNTNLNAGVIIGGLLGGLLFATLVVIGSLFIVRRRHKRNRVSESTIIQPFPVGFTIAEKNRRPEKSSKRVLDA